MTTLEQAVEVGVSLILTIAGLITYYIAPRRGKGTLGFRVGPAYASEEVWARVNREAGAALTATGIAFLAASAAAPPLHVFAALLGGVLAAEVAALTLRAKQLAERESLEEGEVAGEPVPVRTWVGWGRTAVAAVPLIIALSTALAISSYLPEQVPIHFGPSGEPDYFVDKSAFIFVITPTLLLGSAAGLIYALATKHPLIGYRPWGKPGEAAKVISDIVTLVSYAIMLAYVDIVHYSITGAHIMPVWLTALFPVVAVIRALLWAKGREHPMRVRPSSN